MKWITLPRRRNSRQSPPRVEFLEERSCPSSSAVTTFAGNPQHTADFVPAGQNLSTIKWHTPVDLHPQYSGTDLLIHYGAPLFTANNTVLVPVKTGPTDGFEVNAFNAATGALMYTLPTDYTLPSHGWTPSYSPALVTTSTDTRLYYAGAGGTISYIDNPDSSTPPTPVQQVFYTTLANYQANAAAFNSTVFIDTPITSDSSGNIYFGFRVQGTAPAPLNTTQSGYARIDPNGNGTYILVGNAAGDGNISLDSHNAAPALSNDGSTLYVVVKSSSSYYGYLLGLDSTTLATKYKVFLIDPSSGSAAGILDDGTSSPMVAPDGTVYYGIFGNPYNGSRGYLLHFSADLTTSYTPGAFGWDYTPAVVPASMVPEYTGTSSYLIFMKYNNYAGSGGEWGNGVNQVALLDPNAVELDPHNDGNPNLLVMREVLTVPGPTPDPGNVGANSPHAVREWCINTAAVDQATDSIYFPSEDGNLYQWNLAQNSLAQSITLGSGIGEAYVPTEVGPDGTVYSINNAILYAVGNQTGVGVSLTSSSPNVQGDVAGQSITFTAKVTGSGVTPTGTITFQDGSSTLATVTLDPSGQAVYSTTALTAAAHFISAVYSGDSNYPTGTATLVQFVHASGTTTTLTSSPDPSTSGQAVTFTATVTPNLSGLGTPTGMVTFLLGTTVLGQNPLNGSGQATFTTSALAVGSDTITAVYYSDPVYATSSGDDSASPQVVQEGTTTTVSSTPNPSVTGQQVTVTAQVASQNSAAGIPTGTVTFTQGSTVLASGVAVDATGKATFTTTALPVGSDTITATFNGNTGWLTSSGDDSAAPQVVNPDATTTTVATSGSPSVFGQSVTFTATVTANSPGSGTPGGTVTFMDGNNVLGTGTLGSNGQATFTTSSLSVASHSITAVYGGSTSYNGSTSAVLTQKVNKAATRTTVVSSQNPSTVGQAVTFTATVLPVAPGAGTPTGTITFKDGTTVLATVTLTNGQAAFTTSSLKKGRHSITATYSGDPDFVRSVSAVLHQTVNGPAVLWERRAAGVRA
jgi:hypothetical protein